MSRQTGMSFAGVAQFLRYLFGRNSDACDHCGGTQHGLASYELGYELGRKDGAYSLATFLTMAEALRKSERDKRIQETRDQDERRYRRAMEKVWGSTDGKTSRIKSE